MRRILNFLCYVGCASLWVACSVKDITAKPKVSDVNSGTQYSAWAHARSVQSFPPRTVAYHVLPEVGANVGSIPGSQTRYFSTLDMTDTKYAERLFNNKAIILRFLNTECIREVGTKFFKVLIAQGVFESLNLKRYIRVSIAIAGKDLQASLSLWRHEIRNDPDDPYSCSSSGMKHSPPLSDAGDFGIAEVKSWLHSKIGHDDKILGIRFEEITGNGFTGNWDIKHEATYHIINT